MTHARHLSGIFGRGLTLIWILTVLAANVAQADIQISFSPSTLSLAPGQVQTVQMNVSDVPAAGLAAFQMTLNFAPAQIRVEDPNAGPNAALAQPFAPLGGNATICQLVRGGACNEPAWFLTSTGRSPLSNVLVDNVAGSVRIAYVTSGGAAPSGSGTIALLRVVGGSAGTSTLTLSNVVFGAADAQSFPSVQTPPLAVSVGAGSVATAPTIDTVPAQANREGDAVSVSVAARDADGDTLSFSASGLPAGIGINASTGLISGTLAGNSAGGHNVTVTVADNSAAALSASITFRWTVGDVNHPPGITPVTAVNSSENTPVAVQIVAADVDGDALVYTATGLPPGVTINAATGLISGNLSFNSANAYRVAVTVADNGEPSSSAAIEFNWLVANVNRAPLLSLIEPITLNEGTTGSVQVSASDSDADDTLHFIVQDFPAFASFVDGGDGIGLLRLVPGLADAGTYTIRIQVIDDGVPVVLSSAQTVVVTVVNVNQAPVVTPPPAQSHEVGQTVSLQIVATDPDRDPLSYTASTLPPGLSINSGTGLISGTIQDSGGASTSYRTRIGVSDQTEIRNAEFDWTITRPAASISLTSPGNQTAAEGDTVALPIVASSSDQGALIYTAEGLPAGLSIDTAGVIQGSLGYDLVTQGPSSEFQVSVSAALQSNAGQRRTVSFVWVVTNTNRPPLAKAGLDRNTQTATAVTLDGSSSSDEDGDTLTFTWQVVRVPSGSQVSDDTLVGAGTPQVTFTPDVDGEYELSLEVNDGKAASTDSVLVVAKMPPNIAPNVNVGKDQQVKVRMPVTLDASGSNDPDNGPQPLNYRWVLAILPTDSALTSAHIANVNTPQASFTPDVAGDYVLSLTVSDGQDSAQATTRVTAVPANVAPVADAGPDQIAKLGTQVQLDGSASRDSDRYPQALSFTWTVVSVPAGSVITHADIADANLPVARFTPDKPGSYLLRLDVKDGEASAMDQVMISVEPVSGAPAAPAKVKIASKSRIVGLIWTPSKGATKYQVYRRLDSETSFKRAAYLDRVFHAEIVPVGVRVAEYYVIAENEFGQSAASATVRAEIRR